MAESTIGDVIKSLKKAVEESKMSPTDKAEAAAFLDAPMQGDDGLELQVTGAADEGTLNSLFQIINGAKLTDSVRNYLSSLVTNRISEVQSQQKAQPAVESIPADVKAESLKLVGEEAPAKQNDVAAESPAKTNPDVIAKLPADKPVNKEELGSLPAPTFVEKVTAIAPTGKGAGGRAA